MNASSLKVDDIMQCIKKLPTMPEPVNTYIDLNAVKEVWTKKPRSKKRRIRNKWRKRYAYEAPAAFKIGSMMIVHPAIYSAATRFNHQSDAKHYACLSMATLGITV